MSSDEITEALRGFINDDFQEDDESDSDSEEFGINQ